VKTRVAHLLPISLMFLLAALTLWLQYAVLDGSFGSAKPAAHDPAGIVENFSVQKLDPSGRLQYTFSSPKMVYFADDDSGEAIYPRLVQISAEGGNITASANRGTINRQGEEAFLYGNVLISREATPQQSELQARTEFLHVLTEQGISRTDHTVTITDGSTTLTGVGMVVDRRRRQFTLQSQVKGIFSAPDRK
jgi:lipopolysaccharide export system protein LptC